ncbi:MAG: hypothetical protein ACREL5_08815 [Gemmatimonadales bacterium]
MTDQQRSEEELALASRAADVTTRGKRYQEELAALVEQTRSRPEIELVLARCAEYQARMSEINDRLRRWPRRRRQ